MFDRLVLWILRSVFLECLRRSWDELDISAYTHQSMREARGRFERRQKAHVEVISDE